MTISAWSPISGLDNFLYAPIGKDKHGTLLCVRSALARLDVDPWAEAARLAQLPQPAATSSLAALLEAVPDRPDLTPNAAIFAAHLIARLPGRDDPGPGKRAPDQSPSRSWVVPLGLLLAVMFAYAYIQSATLPEHRQDSRTLSSETQK